MLIFYVILSKFIYYRNPTVQKLVNSSGSILSNSSGPLGSTANLRTPRTFSTDGRKPRLSDLRTETGGHEQKSHMELDSVDVFFVFSWF